jgi:putative ABC transport system permease protein
MISLLRRIAASHPVLLSLWEAVGIGLDAIRAYKLRSTLTIVGVVMGIMTVTGMSSIVAGLNASMASQIESLGSAVIFVRPFGPGENIGPEEFRRRKGLSLQEVEALKELKSLRSVAPIEPLAYDTIKYGSQRVKDTTLVGATEHYESVHDVYVDKGRNFTAADVNRGAPVALIGADVADALFPFVDPVDKEFTIDGRRFRVIGVIEKKGKFLFFSRDNIIIVPLGSFQKKDPRFNFLVADVKPVSAARIDDTAEEVRELLRRQRKLKYREKDTFAIFTQSTFTDLYTQVTSGIYFVMVAISSIGLLVGGVGVMNIMLVSVTERTREIGVRKALGARNRDILWQFLTEAMTLTATGGILGIVIGGLVAWLVNWLSPFPALLQPFWVMAALVTSLAVGLTFGLWPALKAARLDPIEALRYE